MNERAAAWLDRCAARDEKLSKRVAALANTPARRTLAQLLAHSGDSQFWLVAGALLWRNPVPARRTAGGRIIATTLLGALLSYALKRYIQRPRPGNSASGLYLPFDRHSFPSGHATRIGGLLITLGQQLSWGGRALLTLWGLVVCLSRVALGIHFVGDVVAGLFSGMVMGLLLLGNKRF